MKRVVTILSILFISSFITYSQQTVDKPSANNNDSLKIKTNYSPFLKMQTMFDEFELHREFKNIKMSVPLDGDPQTVWLRTSVAISNMEYLNDDISSHFLSPLEKQYLEESKLNPFKYALGILQAGAAGYIAYKHIKKYGFLK